MIITGKGGEGIREKKSKRQREKGKLLGLKGN